METNMTKASEILSAKFFGKTAATKPASTAWQVRKMLPAEPPRPLLRRLFSRPEPTTFQRCLAVHMHYSTNPRSGLS
jgi:hypothetical protein